MSDENKIIGLDGKPAGEQKTEQPAETLTKQPPALNNALADKIAGAFAELYELAQQKVQTRENEARIIGNRKFLAEVFLVHGPELLGSWFTVRGEYEPLLKVIAQVTNRTVGILAASQAHRAELAKQAAKNPEGK